jgi:cytochrome c553
MSSEKNIYWLACVLLLVFLGATFNPSFAQVMSEEDRSTIADHMHGHLTQISAIKAAIVAGRLEDVDGPARWLADHETAMGLPVESESYVTQMKSHARRVSEAQDLGSAAKSVSNMAKTCGNCHLVNEVNLEFGYDQKPHMDLGDVVTHMQRHQWAMDRLWEGLLGPSDTAWKRGADMLIDVPLLPSDVTRATANTEEIAEIAHRIHALGGIGTETKTPDARSELYAELLGLCARCHKLVGNGPATR